MSQKANCIDTWHINLGARQQTLDALSCILGKENIAVQPFSAKTSIPFGMILVNGVEYYEQLVSLLQIQLKHLGHRIIVVNTAPAPFSRAETMKIFNYGAEYIFENAVLSQSPESITEKIKRWRNIESMLGSAMVKRTIVGESNALKKLTRSIIEVAVYSDTSVLIQGERGTGKELVARLIHDLSSANKGGDLILVDCTTVRAELSGSEFFGHEKGSYTGADRTREGAFALAHNGTLFLDEVGELPLSMQAELLRIIQEGAYKKLGSNTWRQTTFRLVGATNRNLDEETERGTFRKDLKDRISLCKCYMPTLNERKEDIPLLAMHFFKKKFGEALPSVDSAVIDYLKERDYPGNIREMQNLIKRICLRYVGKGPITLGDIPEYDRGGPTAVTEEAWYEKSAFINAITQALNSGYDAKMITDMIKSLTTKVALTLTGNNREVSMLLGKSERWIQLQKAKEK